MLVTSVAQAGLMRTTMDLTITEIIGDYSTVADSDVFQLRVEYDDEGTYMQRYDNDNHCLSTHVLTPGVACGSTHDANRFGFFSNATFNIFNMFNTGAVINDGNQFYERTNYNIARVYEVDNEARSYINTDRFYSNTIFFLRTNGTRSINMYYRDVMGGNKYTRISFTASNIVTSNVEVPEPTTLAIFALGLMGLASRRYKKQS